MPDLALTSLDHLTVLDIRGADALAYLNGQLSNDTTRLPERGAMLAGLHNPQGRVLAMPRLFHLAADHVLAVLPASVAPAVLAQLRKYVLRARVRIEETGATWKVYGITGPDAEAAASTRLHMPMDASQWRQMIVAPRGEPAPEGDACARGSWLLEDIASGIADVDAATSGQFVAQMLNLDLLDAIDFEKGCYTGQEVIARAHFRGQVKRRMQRFAAAVPEAPEPGERVVLADGRAALVVSAAMAGEDHCELLAVTALPHLARATDLEAEASAGTVVLPTTPLPLPYALPGPAATP